MRVSFLAAVIACAGLAGAPCWAQSGGGSNNHAVHNWNTNAFAAHPASRANTNAFAARPASRANTNAFAVHPPANTNAFGTSGNGHEVTAFGNGRGPTTNAFGNNVNAAHNARRLAGSFGTGNDYGASPVGSHLGASRSPQAIGQQATGGSR